MSDALTNTLVDRMKSASPMVIKYVFRFRAVSVFVDLCSGWLYRYVPYGALKDVSKDPQADFGALTSTPHRSCHI